MVWGGNAERHKDNAYLRFAAKLNPIAVAAPNSLNLQKPFATFGPVVAMLKRVIIKSWSAATSRASDRETFAEVHFLSGKPLWG